MFLIGFKIVNAQYVLTIQ